MKTILFSNTELKMIKNSLASSNNESYNKIMHKIEKAEANKTDYDDVIFDVLRQAHEEVLYFFKKHHITELNFTGSLYITRNSYLDKIVVEEGLIIGYCTNSQTFDISYSSTLTFIIKYIREIDSICLQKTEDNTKVSLYSIQMDEMKESLLCITPEKIIEEILSSDKNSKYFGAMIIDRIHSSEDSFIRISRQLLTAYRRKDCNEVILALSGWTMKSMLYKFKEVQKIFQRDR